MSHGEPFMDQPLALRRARHALGEIEALRTKGHYGKYASYVRALPAQILQNGLGQAMATLLAAAGGNPDGHRALYDHIQAWLCRSDPDAPYPTCSALMNAITEHGEVDYLRAQAEALAYLQWLKKFAVAFLDDVQEGD